MVRRLEAKLAAKRRREAIARARKLRRAHGRLRAKHALQTHAFLRGREHLYDARHPHMRTPGFVWGLLIIIILMAILFFMFVR